MPHRPYLLKPYCASGMLPGAWRAAKQRAGELAEPCDDCRHIACPIEVDDEDSTSRDCQACTSCSTLIRD